MKPHALLVLLSAVLSLAATADTTRVTSDLKVATVVKQADGTELLAPAQTVKPGDLLQYSSVHHNPMPRAVSRLVTSLPIPAGTEWVANGTLPSPVAASLDGKVFAPVPLMRKVRRADGQWAEVAVPHAEYRALRWAEQQVPAGGSTTAVARVRVVASATPAPAATVAR